MGFELKQLLNWIYFSRCQFCKKTGEKPVCQQCFEKIKINSGIPIKVLSGVKVYSACEYSGQVRNIIKGLKYKNKRKFAATLAELIDKQIKMAGLSEDFTIVPVPLHFTRLIKRGYNQTELIAKELAKLGAYKLNTKMLKRKNRTKALYDLSREQRENEVREAFSVNKKYLCEGQILILDDICTSGSTLNEVIKTLKNENMNDLCAIVVANPQQKTEK